MQKKLIAISVMLAVSGPLLAQDGAVVKHGTLKARTGESAFKINGRLMYDWDSFDGAHNDANNGASGSQTEIRRARIAVTSRLNKRWKGKLQINFDTSAKAKIKDAYIQRKGDSVTLTVGQHKEPMGLEELTSSKYISTIERAMVTDAFAPSRNIGISFKGGSKTFLWQAGLFSDGDDATNTNKQLYAVTGRLVFAPLHGKGRVMHLGLGYSSRDLGGNGYQFKERAEVHTAEKIVTSYALTAADSMTIGNLEAAMVMGPFSLQGEYYKASVTSGDSNPDADFSGYYVMGSYFFTGESRPYKHGKFGKVKPRAEGGAWELVARYSVLDGIDNNGGRKGTNATVGVNWYLDQSMRVMLNYIDTSLDAPTTLAYDSGKAVSARFQYIW